MDENMLLSIFKSFKNLKIEHFENNRILKTLCINNQWSTIIFLIKLLKLKRKNFYTIYYNKSFIDESLENNKNINYLFDCNEKNDINNIL